MKTPEQRARHNETTKRSREKLWAQNPDRLCPPEHRHGETANCYINHGCRCDNCINERNRRRYPLDWHSRRMRGANVWVSAIGSRRRLEALAFMGWSAGEIAKLIDSHYRPLLKIRGGENARVTIRMHQKIAAIYKKLALVKAPGRSGKVTRGHARSKGYHSPLAWGNIDDKNDTPDTKRELSE